MRRLAGAVSTLVLLSSCATVVNRPLEQIPVRSDPSGAVVTVDCGSAPIYGGVTPTTISVERAVEKCAVTIAKDGFREERVDFRRERSKVTLANEVPGIFLGTTAAVLATMLVWEAPSDGAGDFIVGAYTGGHFLGTAPAQAIDRKSGAAWKQVPGEVFVRLKTSAPSTELRE